MKNILLFASAVLLCASLYAINVPRHKTGVNLDKTPLSISCSGNVHFYITQPGSTDIMEGRISMTTLGGKRLALEFSGQLTSAGDRFTLSRTLMMDYLYHADNHILEMNYARSHISEVDTAPEDVFYRALMKSHMFILQLSRLSDNALLVSDATTPLYVCVTL